MARSVMRTSATFSGCPAREPAHSLGVESLNGIDATCFEGWNQGGQYGYGEEDAGSSEEHQGVPGIDLKKETLKDMGAAPSPHQSQSQAKSHRERSLSEHQTDNPASIRSEGKADTDFLPPLGGQEGDDPVQSCSRKCDGNA